MTSTYKTHQYEHFVFEKYVQKSIKSVNKVQFKHIFGEVVFE